MALELQLGPVHGRRLVLYCRQVPHLCVCLDLDEASVASRAMMVSLVVRPKVSLAVASVRPKVSLARRVSQVWVKEAVGPPSRELAALPQVGPTSREVVAERWWPSPKPKWRWTPQAKVAVTPPKPERRWAPKTET